MISPTPAIIAAITAANCSRAVQHGGHIPGWIIFIQLVVTVVCLAVMVGMVIDLIRWRS